MKRNTNLTGNIPIRNQYEKYLFSFIFLVFSIIAFGQEPPQVTITQPINGTVFDGGQITVDYTVVGKSVNSARVLIDDIPVQLLTDAEVKTGKNTITVDVPARSCKISIIARNEFGASLPAAVNLTWSERIFKPTLYVLAVGVSKYNNPDLELNFAAKDAIDFAETLLGQQGLLYEKVNLKILTDRQATAENVRDGLQWLKSETTYQDVAMLFMAGHGINDNVGDFFFMPVNADMNRVHATCVGYREIKSTIDANAGKMLVFMDACHSGNVLGNNQRRTAMLTQAISDLTGADNGAVVFTSSTGRQFSLENPEWSNGAFTKALVEGLNGAADLFKRKTITVNNLSSYVANRVKELTNGQQAPTTIVPSSVPDFPVAVVNVTINVNVTVLQTETTSTERPSTTANIQTATVAPSTSILTAKKRNVYQSDRGMTHAEVRDLMTNTDALKMYNKSIRRNKTGNIMFFSGTGIIALRLIVVISGNAATEDEGRYDNNMISGLYTVFTGIAITGLTLKLNSKKLVSKSVNTYNNGLSRTGMDLKFGITGNGVGVALQF